MNAVDTNVLLYVRDPRDARKQAFAANLVSSLADGVLLWQVACEYLAAARKLRDFGFGVEAAHQDLREMQRVWLSVVPGWGALERAAQLMNRFSLSVWDALLVAACIDAGVDCLYSEDFDAYDRIDGLAVVNPFR